MTVENNNLSDDERLVEEQYWNSLSDAERDEYRIHLHAGGKPACKFLSEPDAPVYQGLSVSLTTKDFEPYPYEENMSIQDRSRQLSEAATRIMENLAILAGDIDEYETELDRRYRTAAEELGLEHVLGN